MKEYDEGRPRGRRGRQQQVHVPSKRVASSRAWQSAFTCNHSPQTLKSKHRTQQHRQEGTGIKSRGVG